MTKFPADHMPWICKEIIAFAEIEHVVDQYRDSLLDHFTRWTGGNLKKDRALIADLCEYIAIEYHYRRMNFEDCDNIVNIIWGYENAFFVERITPPILHSVYGAFDAGGWHRKSDKSDDPVAEYTDPAIAEIVALLERRNSSIAEFGDFSILEGMNEAIRSGFMPLVGLPCWGVKRVHGSILSLEFGSPHLSVREPIVSPSRSIKVRERMAQRRVKPVGRWNLFVFCCHWRVIASGAALAEDIDDRARIDTAAQALDGQKLTGFYLDAASCTTSFVFDLGARLETRPYAADNDEQWSLHDREGIVLTYRADGHCSASPSTAKPGREAWCPIARDVLIP